MQISENLWSCHVSVAFEERRNNEIFFQIVNFEKISVRVRMTDVKEAETVKGGLIKQDCNVSDATGSSRLVLWEKNVDSLEKGLCYRLSGIVV